MLNTTVHPLFVGTLGIVGINTTQAVVSETSLSIILQIIIALSTMLKLYIDYKEKNNNKNNQENG